MKQSHRSHSTDGRMQSIQKTLLILLQLTSFSVALYTDSSATNNCRLIPRDLSIIRRPGDGNFQLRLELIPPGSSRRRGSGSHGAYWPTSEWSSTLTSKSTSQVEYLPGRQYQITVAPNSSPVSTNTHLLEAVYVTAVPLGTPESEEYAHSKGVFTPTICTNNNVGAIEFGYNFPRTVNFLWTAPDEASRARADPNGVGWARNYCVELRATVIPWHWHRVYFRNTGWLRHVMCPARDVRQIEWPNFTEKTQLDSNEESTVKTNKDSVRARSIPTAAQRGDTRTVRDRYSDSGFYGSEESVGSCALQELPKPVRRCCACNTAIYRLVVQSDWQQQQHWRDWPTSTTTADGKTSAPHYSEILGASHSPLYDVFHGGGYASPAVDALCTTSDVSKLENEFRNQAGENILTVIRTRGIDSQAPPEQRIRSALFAVNSSHHLISFLTRLVPSPDWCTGMSRVDICLSNCSWPRWMRFSLEPWDAGVMSGNTYEPVEQSERLRQPKPMCPITPDLRPNTPFTVLTDYAPLAGAAATNMGSSPRSFGSRSMDGRASAGKTDSGSPNRFGTPSMSPELQNQMRMMHGSGSTRLRRRFAPLGTVYLELLRINQNEACTPEPAQEDQGFTSRRASHTVERSVSMGKCQLNTWSQWGPCTSVDLDTCMTADAKSYWSKKPSRRERTRFVLPPSTTADCAGFPLKEEKTCDPSTVVEKCEQIPVPTMTGKGRGPTLESCQSLPWGPWSGCMNSSCVRPGMIYRWREFPNIQAKQACEHYPMVSQVDTCWPPPDKRCDNSELQKACFEEPPASVRLCVRPRNGTVRYFYHPKERDCRPFDYVPDCHLHALVSGHAIGLTRNMFRDRLACSQLCIAGTGGSGVAGGRNSRQLHGRWRRAVEQCGLPKDDGFQCSEHHTSISQWYFDSNRRECVQFNYLGCKGNANRFASELECQQLCL